MVHRTNYSRKAMISMKFSEFEMPPMQDLLIIGKRAPIGSEAVRRMAEALSPEQFSIIKFEHDKIEGVLIRNSLLQMMEEQKLLEIITQEIENMISDTMVIRSELKIEVAVNREVDIS